MYQQKAFSYRISVSSVDQKIQQGLAFHRNGQSKQAQAIYNEVLEEAPSNADALHFLGVLEYDCANFEKAAQLIEQSIKCHSLNPSAYLNLGNAQRALGQYERALASYDKALTILPEYVQAHIGRGAALEQIGDVEEALKATDRALALDPKNILAQFNKGNIYIKRQMYALALECFDAAIAARQDFVDAYINRGAAYAHLGEYAKAIKSLDDAIGVNPRSSRAYFNRGRLAQNLGQDERAIVDYRKAIQLDSSYLDAHINLGEVLMEIGRVDDAIDIYKRAVELDASSHEVRFNLANAKSVKKDFVGAVEDYGAAIRLKPDYVEAFINQGVALKEQGKLLDALASYDQAVILNDRHAGLFTNRGNLLKDLGRVDAALSSYERALALDPENASTKFNTALALLLKGNLEEGWPLYEARWDNVNLGLQERYSRRNRWNGGEDLAGKTILVHSEQGFGDTIQFCRYIKILASIGAKVVFEVDAPLLGLMRQIEGVSEVVELGEGSSLAYDFHCPLMSLPFALRTKLNGIPSAEHYVHADAQDIQKWAVRLGEKNQTRVGLVWRGRATHVNDANRSLQLGLLMQALPEGVEYFCLQKDIEAHDQALVDESGNIRFFGSEIKNFSDTASLCTLMDVVISVDTSVAHLSAALGRPTWILLPFSPDWRWFTDRSDSPWYPSVRLYRQDRPSDWKSVLGRVRSDLAGEYGSLAA